MVIKVYISGSSGNKEVKKRQQRVLLILESKNINYEVLDIAEPNMEEAKEYMQNNSKQMGCTISDPNPRHPLPPQIFNDDEYCGDYDAFDMANEIDEMEVFLKFSPGEIPTATLINGNDQVEKESNGVQDDDLVQNDEPIESFEKVESQVTENQDALEEPPESSTEKESEIIETNDANDDGPPESAKETEVIENEDIKDDGPPESAKETEFIENEDINDEERAPTDAVDSQETAEATGDQAENDDEKVDAVESENAAEITETTE